MTSFVTTLMSVAFSESFSPSGDGPNFVHNESLKSRFVRPPWEKTLPGVL